MMSRKQKRKYLYISLFITSILLIFLSFGFLQTFFISEEQKLVQYNVDQADKDYVSREYFVKLGGRSGQLIGSSNSAPSTDVLSVSTLSGDVTIDNGKHTYEFIALKTEDGRDFGLDPSKGPGFNVLYCWQQIDVKRDGVLIDSLKSWDESNPNRYNEDYFRNNEYIVYDDSSQDSGIIITMDDLKEANKAKAGQGCRIFVNQYQLFYDNETFDIYLDLPQQTIQEGRNISVNVVINNKLDVPISSEVTSEFSIGTFLGQQTLSNVQTTILLPGINTLNYQIPSSSSPETIDVVVGASLGLTGSELQNLNFGHGILAIGECSNTRGDGSCEQYTIYNDAGASPSLQPTRIVNIGSFIESQSLLEINLDSSNNLQASVQNVNQGVSNQQQTSMSPPQTQNLTSSSSNAKAIYSIILFMLLIIILVIIAGIYLSRRKR